MKAYLVNATSGNHTVIGIFTFQHNVLDMDFTNDE